MPSHKRSRKASKKSLPPQLKKMNMIVKELAKSGKYQGNIMKAAAKIYRSKGKVSHKGSRKHSRKGSRK
jgi:hypothetical protein